ncbi:MAG TPA: mucoidy inhibitor MuiA family protein [Trichocoleus sp.]
MGSSQEASQPPSTQVRSTIVAVTLYPDQATVTRRGAVYLLAGTHTLTFSPLPATLRPQTVMLLSHSERLSYLRDVSVHAVAPTPDPQADEKALLESLRTLETAYHRAKDTLTGLYLQRDFLQDLAQRTPRTFAVGLAQQRVSLEDTTALLQFLGQTQEQLLGAIAQAEAQKHSLDRQLQAARQSLETLKKQANLCCYAVTVQVEVSQTGNYEFDLIYGVEGVCWKPHYRIRLLTAESALHLTRLAYIEQGSGEDWCNVALTLSTGRPLTAIAPEVPPQWVLSLSPEFTRRGTGSRTVFSTRSPSLEEAYRMLGAVPGSELPPIKDVRPLGSSSERTHTLVSLQMLERPTLPHQEHPTLIEIDCHTLPCELVRLALPQTAPHPYIRARLFSTLEGLLPGPVKVFRDEVYLGEMAMPTLHPGHPFTLSFGLDDSIHLTHQLVEREGPKHLHKADSNIAPPRQEAFRYCIHLHNAGTVSQNCLVIAQVPVSQHDELQVELTQAEPPMLSSENGQCCWSLSLAAGAEQTLNYQFKVESSSDAVILGLDN